MSIDTSPANKTDNETIATSNFIPIAVSVVLLSLLAVPVGVVITVLLFIWRCRHADHPKHNTGTQASSKQHPQAAISLCEETGQAMYDAVVHDGAEEDASHQNQYSLLQHGSRKVRKTQPHQQPDLDAHFTLSPPAAHPPQLYAQLHKNKSKKKCAVASKSR